MFEFEWARPNSWGREARPAAPVPTGFARDRVAGTALLHWQEHCLECAMPQCYETCSLYRARGDGNCMRFEYGIVPNPAFSGLFDHGADLRFRRWGKLESRLYGRSVSPAVHRVLDRADRALSTLARGIGRLEPRVARSASRRALASARRRLFERARTVPEEPYHEFVLECYSPHPEAFRLMLELVRDDRVIFREALPIAPGTNLHALPVASMNLGSDWSGKITVYPENDAPRRLVFTWLDFVRYTAPQAAAPAGDEAPAPRIKCVAWDLDGTLWRGTLAEARPEELTLDPRAATLVRALDERGILQTVVSKNHHDEAWAVVERFGLGEYFLYPAINWGRKSANLEQIARRLNIHLDSFGLVDDSAFERAEVKQALPQVRVYDSREIQELLERPEFDVPITELSRKRRLSYRVELERERARESFGGDYLEFLRGCGMRMRLFVPRSETAVARCLELIQRSNQLNLSGQRYSAEGFAELLGRAQVLCLAFECEDRFGEYGIVGFASVDERDEIPLLRDLVISCRVAQKRVEHALIQWIAERERERGCGRLQATLVATGRNEPLSRVFAEMPFECVGREAAVRRLELPLDRPWATESVVEVKDEVDG